VTDQNGKGSVEGPVAALRGLNPAWFSLVMATGIVGIVASMQSIPFVPAFLTWANLLFYTLLWVAYLARLAAFPRAFLGDLREHTRAMGFFTIVAGSGVLGAQMLEVGNHRTAAQLLWFVALASWVVIVYAVPVALVAQRAGKPPLKWGIQGNWLLWAVGTQSLAVLGAQVASFFGPAAGGVVTLSLLLWLLGVVFYVWVITLIVGRLFFYDLPPDGLSPTYWIDMGAVAIATLAGATLLGTQAQSRLLEHLGPFVAGLTLLLWATASWWIPWLFAMFFWRHVLGRQPVWFEPGWWSVVFPLGMYSAATAALSEAVELPAVLGAVASVFAWISLAVWVATFVNMLFTWWRRPLTSGT
jgi:tellurite resistance protein TehA-like permease